jgi:Ca2+-transporting ATPase
MGPTCSVIYENEPMEPNAMKQPPRRLQAGLFNNRELAISVLQGIVIAVIVLSLSQWGVYKDYSEPVVRTIVFIALITANIALTLVNRSFHYSLITTLKYRNDLVPLIIIIIAVLTATVMYVPQLRSLFDLHSLSVMDICVVVCSSSLAVLWFEIFKWFRRRRLTSIKS